MSDTETGIGETSDRSELQALRSAIIEECAQLCESKFVGSPNHIVALGFAEEIRALKFLPSPSPVTAVTAIISAAPDVMEPYPGWIGEQP